MVSIMVYLKNNPLAVTAFLILLVVSVIMVPAGAATITIDNSSATAIADNITRANDGDTIILSPGTYFEHNITITGKSLTLRAAAGHGPSDTIIDGSSATPRILNATDAPSLTIGSLAFRNALSDGDGGGAIYSAGNVTVTGSKFTNCSASADGGAIHAQGDLGVTGSTFTSCSTTGTGSPGGALFATGSITVTDSQFSHCSTEGVIGGGALFSMGGTVTVTGSDFTRVTSENGQGGVIYSYGYYPATIRSSTFTDCSGGAGGGAVTTNDDLTVTGSTFTNCSANYPGGAIKSAGAVSITGSDFTNCSAGGGNEGGAVAAKNNLDVTGSTFTRCSATTDGGAILSISGTVTVASSTFTDCSAAHYGGAVSGPAGATTVTSSTFTNCSAGNGGAVAGNDPTFGTSVFTNCSAVQYGGAVYSTGAATVTGSRFTNCSATGTSTITGDGGAIFSAGTVTASGSTFTRCSAHGTGIANGYGGAIVSNDVISLTGSTITGCSAGNGGAVAASSGGTIHFSRLVNNDTGTAVYASGAALDATNNWWGSNAAPSGYTTGTVTTSPWLVLGITASPFNGGPTSTVRANLTYNMDNTGASTDTSALGHLPDDTPVTFTFSAVSGSISPLTGNTTKGVITTLFSPSSGGTARVKGRVDNQDVSVPLTIITAFTATPVSGTVPLTVSCMDTSGFSPAMWNWSFGDGNWFNTTDAARKNPSHTYTNTGSYTVRLITTGASGTDTLTRTGYITVSAVPVSTNHNGDDDAPTFNSPVTTLNVNVGGNSAITRVEVTGTRISGLIVTGTALPGPGKGDAPLSGPVFQYLDLVPAQYTTITSTMIAFIVPQSWMEEHHVTPQDIVMYHNVGGNWQALPTTVLKTATGQMYFSATSPGFSRFAIGVQSTISSTVNGTTISPATVTINDPAGTPPGQTVVQTPGMQATTTAPAISRPDTGFPLPAMALIIAGCVVLIGGGWYVRRWYIRRQNPALFRDYD